MPKFKMAWNDEFPPLNLWNYPMNFEHEVQKRVFADAQEAKLKAVSKQEWLEQQLAYGGHTGKATNVSINDPVNHPKHYKNHPSGVECIQITEHMNFNLGNAIKYLWRTDAKDAPIQDLQKAVWYINREIQRRGGTGL